MNKPVQMNQLQQQLSGIFQLLQQGKVVEAARRAERLRLTNPRNVDVVHLCALCSKAGGHRVAANSHFKNAMALAPTNVQIITNFANFLKETGAHNEAIDIYQRALALDPHFIHGWLGLGAVALQTTKTAIAETAYRKATALQPTLSIAWLGLGSALRASDKLVDAEQAFIRACEIEPHNPAGLINLGVVQRMLGKLTEAMDCFNQAEKAGFQGPELYDGRASVLLDMGKTDESVGLYREICEKFPAYVEGHDALARILYELEPETDAVAILQQAVAAQPNHHALRFRLVRLLNEMERYEEALSVLNAASALKGDVKVAGAQAMIFDSMGAEEEAAEAYGVAVREKNVDADFLLAYVRYLIKAGDYQQASENLSRTLELAPNHQLAWAYQGTLWRLTDDPREEWLHDYEQFIQPCEIEVPDEFNSIEEFLVELQGALKTRHAAKREPVDQSLRGGSQTSGNLFGSDDPVISAAREAIRESIMRVLQDLPTDAKHPFLCRNVQDIRFAGAWSVLLKSGGKHINHVHSRGWLSSAFYVSLPEDVTEDCGDGVNDNAGWIQFGQPPLDLGLELEPRRFIQPKPGTFALFPSYTWHGTVPFTKGTERLTMAYDVVPC